jgi:regulator of protease activity HflC (stomatin/prohibitin superfamily)
MVTEMAEYSIRVDDFLITNIDFTDGFKKAIEDKVIVAQQAQAEQNRVAIARAQAEPSSVRPQRKAKRTGSELRR